MIEDRAVEINVLSSSCLVFEWKVTTESRNLKETIPPPSSPPPPSPPHKGIHTGDLEHDGLYKYFQSSIHWTRISFPRSR